MPTRFNAPEDVRGIYRLYPRKIRPNDAHKAIEAAIVRLEKKLGISRVSAVAYLRYRTKLYADAVSRWPETKVKGRDIRPYPTTWFNGDRFSEDASEWEAKRGGAEEGFQGADTSTPESPRSL